MKPFRNPVDVPEIVRCQVCVGWGTTIRPKIEDVLRLKKMSPTEQQREYERKICNDCAGTGLLPVPLTEFDQ